MSAKFFPIEDRFSPGRHNAHNTESAQQIVTIYDNWTKLTTKRRRDDHQQQSTLLLTSSGERTVNTSCPRPGMIYIPLPELLLCQHWTQCTTCPIIFPSLSALLGVSLHSGSVDWSPLMSPGWGISHDKSSNYQVNRTLLISPDGVPSQPLLLRWQ